MTTEISTKTSNTLRTTPQGTQPSTLITWTGEYKNDIFVYFETLYLFVIKYNEENQNDFSQAESKN